MVSDTNRPYRRWPIRLPDQRCDRGRVPASMGRTCAAVRSPDPAPRTLGIAIVAAVAAGVALGPVNPIFATVTQENTPPRLLGRVFGALTAIAQSAIPVGALLAGAVVQGAGLIPTIVGMGVVYVVLVIGMFFNPRLRGMDVRHEPVSEPTDSGAVPDGEALSASRRTDIR
jgi:MFS family permease